MTRTVTELGALNGAERGAFVAALGGIFENAPWVAEHVVASRPFATVADLHRAADAGCSRHANRIAGPDAFRRRVGVIEPYLGAAGGRLEKLVGVAAARHREVITGGTLRIAPRPAAADLPDGWVGVADAGVRPRLRAIGRDEPAGRVQSADRSTGLFYGNCLIMSS